MSATRQNRRRRFALLRRRGAVLWLLALAVASGGIVWFFSGDRAGPLVVYCAHDAGFAEKILRDFAKSTGTPVALHFAPAADAPGFPEQIIREKGAPGADVFWNDDVLGMLDLQERGLLRADLGADTARIPARFKAADGSWTGFAARVRVIIANTARIGTTPPNLEALLPGSDRSKIALAPPLRGSGRAHYTALWQLWGAERLQAWHRDWRAGGVQECDGDRAVQDLVAEGVCFAGYAESDDYFAAKDKGRPVTMHPARLENGQTMVIPDTVAMLRDSKRPRAARRLVEFLISAETELALAQSKARRIPLGAVPADQVPAEVRELVDWSKESVDFTALGPARAECQAWLQAEYHP